MAKIEIQLPDRIDNEITRLVDQGEFMNMDRAIEEVLSLGVSAYDTTDLPDDEPVEGWEMQAIEDQRDPSLRTDSPPDEGTF